MRWLKRKAEMLRVVAYSELVSSMPEAETRLGVWVRRIAKSPQWKRRLVRWLKPTHFYRVYQDRGNERPMLQHAVPFRWNEKEAFSHALVAATCSGGKRCVILRTEAFISEAGEDRFPILRQLDKPDEAFQVKFDTDDLSYGIEYRVQYGSWKLIDVWAHSVRCLSDIITDFEARTTTDVNNIYRLVMFHRNLPDGKQTMIYPDVIQYNGGSFTFGDIDHLEVKNTYYYFGDEEVRCMGGDSIPKVGEPRIYGRQKYWTESVQYNMLGNAIVKLYED